MISLKPVRGVFRGLGTFECISLKYLTDFCLLFKNFNCHPDRRIKTFSNKSAFTLAEVLITLVVIGVIAAITISLMIVNYQKYVYYTKFMKAYTTLNSAVQKSIADNGPINTWNINKS